MPSDWDINVAGTPGASGGPQGLTGATGPVGPGYAGTSTTNLPIGLGTVVLTTQTGLAYLVGTRMRISSNSDPTQWMEGWVTAYSGTSLTLNVDLNNLTTSASPTGFPAPTACGRLTYVSVTSLKFVPFNGDVIRINGVYYKIPPAGVSIANTAVYINGVVGNLAANTFYWVYLFNNAGVLTADFCTTGHSTSATSGNVGTEIKTGDDTRTLIGIICTTGTQFVNSGTQRFVRSWFNRTAAQMYNGAQGAIGPNTNWPWYSVTFVCFSDDVITGMVNGTTITSDVSSNVSWTLFSDGSQLGSGTSVSTVTVNAYYPMNVSAIFTSTEGASHTLTLALSNSASGNNTHYTAMNARVG